MIKSNFHTHTARCKHADGLPVDYAAEAVRKGATALGISCHTPYPDNRWHEYKMEYSELPAYFSDIKDAASFFPGLKIYSALECEYMEEFRNYYVEELRGLYKCDYLIGAVHFFKHNGSFLSSFYDVTSKETLHSVTDYFIKTAQSGLFDFIAHPDVHFASWLEWDKEAEATSRAMLQAVKDLGLIVEINCHGFRKPLLQTSKGERPPYPVRQYWEIAAEMDLPVIVTSDAHSPRFVLETMEAGYEFARSLGLRTIDFESYLSGKIDRI